MNYRLSDAPLGRIDSNLIMTLAGVTAADRAVRLVSQVADPGSLASVARRFVEVDILHFSLEGGDVYVTVTDVIALTTAAIVLVRFVVWLISPLCFIVFRRRKLRSQYIRTRSLRSPCLEFATRKSPLGGDQSAKRPNPY